MPYLSASAVVIHYEEALYQVYAPLPLPSTAFQRNIHCRPVRANLSLLCLLLNEVIYSAYEIDLRVILRICYVASKAQENDSVTMINIAMYVAGAVSLLLLGFLLVFVICLRVRLTGLQCVRRY